MTRYRSRWIWWAVYLPFTGFIGLICLGGVFAADKWAAKGGCLCLTLGIAAGLLRARNAGFDTSASGLVVRGLLGRERSLQWAEIAEFELEPANEWFSQFIVVVTHDGRRLRTEGLLETHATSKRAAVKMAALRAERERYASS
jgi:hypothetical protein